MLRKVLLVFLLTRFVIFLIAYVSSETIPVKNTELVLLNTSQIESSSSFLLSGDPGWYKSIADAGYEKRPFSLDCQANWAFFPLWPLLIRYLSQLTGNYELSGILLSNLLFFLSSCLLYRIVEKDFGESVAERATLYVSVFPSTYYFVRHGPESLFLLLVLISFWYGRKAKWAIAGISGFLLSLTRVQGIILLLPISYLYFKEKFSRRENVGFDFIYLLLMPLGLVSFMYYLYRITGNPFAFSQIQKTWGNAASFPFHGLISYLRNSYIVGHSGWDLGIASVTLTILFLSLTAYMYRVKGFGKDYFLYSLASVFVVISRTSFLSTLRYLALIFPAFILLGWLGRKNFVHNIILVSFSVALAFMVALAANNYYFAIA